ncbi:hypothetical protein [Devosia sp. Root105]|uniref:hypothetical protein n=1 Tax=Devosia sp. Root105 TaxID=1736423 RepID=UPI0006FC7465|nr:hypothetical protein [Devosia sp. Root105]KQV08910.1 hypothetical protein ASC68_00875 [Devosia sp. Root105]
MDWTILKDVLLALLAVYGAVLSTINWRNAARKDQRLVKVNMGTAMLTYTDGTLGAPFAQIEATNVGHRAVTISSLYIGFPDNKKMVVTSNDAFGKPDTRLPVELKDGSTAVLYMPYADIADTLHRAGLTGKVVLTPIAADTAGGLHRGAPWTTSADELMATARA